jgi:hypothetical protein
MARFAVIENTEVKNVILANTGFELDGAVLVELDDESMVSPGWMYQDGIFVEPVQPEPTTEPQSSPTPSSGDIPVTEF